MQADAMTKTNEQVPCIRFPEFKGPWQSEQLGTLAEFTKGRGVSKQDISANGELPCIRYAELYTVYGEVIKEVISRTSLSSEELELSQADDVIIPASGESAEDIARAACVMNAGIALGGDLNIIRSPLDGTFLAYHLNSKQRLTIARLAQGKSVVHLYPEQLRQLDIRYPALPEQRKIAAFLATVDEKIQQLSRSVVTLKTFRQGIMQQLFSGVKRFSRSDGSRYPDWRSTQLSDLLYESKHRNRDLAYKREHVLSVSREYGIVNQVEFQGRSFAGVTLKDYKVVEPGDIVYTKSPLRSNPYGVIKSNKGPAGVVSTLYAVYKCTPLVLPEYLDFYFDLDDNTNGYLRPLVHKGAKNDMKINNDRVLIGHINLPSLEEQSRIAGFLRALDAKVAGVAQALAAAQQWKKGLLQQMFV